MKGVGRPRFRSCGHPRAELPKNPQEARMDECISDMRSGVTSVIACGLYLFFLDLNESTYLLPTTHRCSRWIWGRLLRFFRGRESGYLLKCLQTLEIDSSNAWVNYSPGDTHDHMIPLRMKICLEALQNGNISRYLGRLRVLFSIKIY